MKNISDKNKMKEIFAIEVTKKGHPLFSMKGWIKSETEKMFFIEFDKKKTLEERVTFYKGKISSISGPYWLGYILKKNVKIIPKAEHIYVGSKWHKTSGKYMGKTLNEIKNK